MIREELKWIHDYVSAEPPIGWKLLKVSEDGMYFSNGKLAVIVSAGVELDNKRWIHLSLTKKKYLKKLDDQNKIKSFDKKPEKQIPFEIPGWADLVRVKEMFLGDETQVLQILPPKDKYVNINPGVLHLWFCPDGDGIPDFTRGGDTI